MAGSSYFDEFALLYDRLQPVIIESYSTYQSIALDLLPDQKDEHLRILDLGCGTAEFLKQVLYRRPNYQAVAINYIQQPDA
jgi:ubiquinone/menaquinone biosynthesis C-methylase UbiE